MLKTPFTAAGIYFWRPSSAPAPAHGPEAVLPRMAWCSAEHESNSAPCWGSHPAQAYLSSSWRHGASFPGLLRESEAAGRGECGPGCRSRHPSFGGTPGRHGCVWDVRFLFWDFLFLKTQFPSKRAAESQEFTHQRGRLHTGSRLHAPGRIYRSNTGMLASWRATTHRSVPVLAASSEQHREAVSTRRRFPGRKTGTHL